MFQTRPTWGGESIGIDVQVIDLAVCSDGHIYENINKTKRIKKLENKLRRLQRKVTNIYEKKKKGENTLKQVTL